MSISTRLVCLSLCLVTLAPKYTEAQESSHADFEWFAQAFEGRWIGEVTLPADLPGIGKQGEQLTCYSHIFRENDDRMLRAQVYQGDGAGTWTITYDAHSKRIRSLWVNSGGRTSSGVLYRDDDGWIESGEGSTAAGEKTQFKNVVSVSKDGNTHTWVSESSVGGKAMQSRNDVWRRISGRVLPAEGSKLLQELGDVVIGRWVGDVVFIADWPGHELKRGGTVTGYSDFQWTHDKHAIIRQDYSGTGHGTSLYVFDPGTRTILFTLSGEAGAVQGRLLKLENGDWLQTFDRGGTSDGKIIGGAAIWRFSPDGSELQFAGTLTLDGQPLDKLVDKFKKVSP